MEVGLGASGVRRQRGARGRWRRGREREPGGREAGRASKTAHAWLLVIGCDLRLAV